MSDSKKLSVGKELTDDELMEMTGGNKFYTSNENILVKPENPNTKDIIKPDVIAKYGIHPYYGIQPDIVAKYGVLPNIHPYYGIRP